MAARGSYAVGIRKRQRLLDAALQVIADQGYKRASVREIAEAAEVSAAGLIHYFGTKEDLFVAILHERDERDILRSTQDGPIPIFLEVMRHNASVPGLVRLYMQMLAEASDPGHPAHRFFTERTERVNRLAHEAVTAAQEAGTIRSDLDPAWVLRAAHALADGLQAAWLLDPEVDMAADIEQFIEVLRPQG